MLSYEQMLKNVSLVFANTHFSEGSVRAFVPALVEIGGIQNKEQPDELPKDIADFVNNAPDGFILFSLGSNLQPNTLNPQVLQVIYKVFSQLKQRVILKWDDLSRVPGNASNIMYKSWLPQLDLLAQPNIKLFVTHCGKGGMAEAQFYGVPMITMPGFGDQTPNSNKIVKAGFGLKLDLTTLDYEQFRAAVQEVLQNPKYMQNIKKFAQLYRDRPLSAKQNVVYWSEYVMRHHGAAHMQSPLVHMNFVQANNLDVLATVLAVFYLLYKLAKLTVKLAKKYFGSRRKLKQN